ncbi:hypothetical protein RFI_33956, partial [Reticulomyxa filosa]
MDCIDKNHMSNVYVTKEQLQLMQPMTKPITDLKLRKKSRRQLEDEPIRWLPEWLNLFEDIKQITLDQHKSRLDFSILSTIVMEYNNENERKDEKSSFFKYFQLKIQDIMCSLFVVNKIFSLVQKLENQKKIFPHWHQKKEKIVFCSNKYKT